MTQFNVKVTEIWNAWKTANFKGNLLRLCNQKTNGELWYSKTISKF